MISLNVAKLLQRLGGPIGLIESLRRHDQPVPQYAAVAQWKSRNTLPRRWTAPIFYVLAQEGIAPIDLMDNLPEDGPEDDDDPFADTEEQEMLS